MSLSSSASAANPGADEAAYDVPAAPGAYGVPTAEGSPGPAEAGPGLSFSAVDVALVLGGGLILLSAAAMSVVLVTRVATHRTAAAGRRPRRRLATRVASGAIRR